MTLDFDILFSLFFRHTYFLNSKLEHLTVTPTKESARLLINNGMLFKPLKDGFRILFETNQAGQKRERAELLQEALTLRFMLTLTDRNFYNYTAITTDAIKDSVFYFHNTPSNKNTSGLAAFHQEDVVSEKDLRSTEAAGDTSFVKPFGIIDVELVPSLALENTILFDKKMSYWQYIVVSEHLTSLTDLAIIDTSSQAVFEGPEKIKLPDKREALLFTSLSPISIAEKPADLFQLVENYESGSGRHKVVKRALPVPDITSVSSASGKSNAEKKTIYSEIFIY